MILWLANVFFFLGAILLGTGALLNIIAGWPWR